MAIHYVEKTGDDANDGSSGSPFLTVQQGMDTAIAGDTVMVGAGVYDEAVNTIADGSSGALITLDGGSVATVTRLRFYNPYNYVKNLTIKGYANPNYALIEIYRGSHYSVLDNCLIDGEFSTDRMLGIRFQNPSTKPFNTDAASNVTIKNCELTGILGSTVLELYGDNNIIENCNFHDVGACDFIRFFGRDSIIRDNVFVNNIPVEGSSNHIDWAQTLGQNGYGSSGHVFERNYVANVAGGIVQMEGNLVPEVTDITFRHNIIEDIVNGTSCNVPNVKWHNNTFIRVNAEESTGSHVLSFSKSRYYTDGEDSGVPGESGYQWAHGGEALNNVFYECGEPTSTYVGWYFFHEELIDIVADYNYVGKAGYSPVSPNSLEESIGDAGGWNNYRWWEDNGINGGDPDFYDPTDTLGPDGAPFTDDDGFLQVAGSLLIGAASDGGDIGAYETAGEPPVPVPPNAPTDLTLTAL